MFLKVDLYSDSKSVELNEIDTNVFKMKSSNDYVQLQYYLELWLKKKQLKDGVHGDINVAIEDSDEEPKEANYVKPPKAPQSAHQINIKAEINNGNAVNNCMTPKKEKSVELSSDGKKKGGCLTDRGEASKGKVDSFPGSLQIEMPDGTMQYLELDYMGIESWLRSEEDQQKLLDYLKDWEKNNNDYISEFTNEFGAVSYDGAPEDLEEEEDESPTKKKKAQPGNFEFDDDDEPSMEGGEVDFDAMMKAKKKAAMQAKGNDDSVDTLIHDDDGEGPPPKLSDLLKKQLEFCLPKELLNPPKSKKQVKPKETPPLLENPTKAPENPDKSLNQSKSPEK